MRKIIVPIIALILCIPIIVAIVDYNSHKQDTPEVRTVSSMTLTVLSGKTYEFTSEDPDSEGSKIIQLFVDLTANATKVSQLPLQLNGRHYSVTFSSKSSLPYSFYFTSNPEICYYTNETTTYKLDAENSRKFLCTPYASDLFESSQLPALTLSGNIVVPSEASWYFEAPDGSFVPVDVEGLTTQQVVQYDVTGGLGVSFSEDPDYCTFVVSDASTNAELFNGTLSQLSSLDLSGRGPLSVRINASWGQGLGRAWNGELQYRFLVNIAAPAEFFLKASASNQLGDVMTLTAYNVDNVNAIGFSSSIENLPAPRFFAVSSDNYAVALLPIPLDAPVGEATITLTYNGITKTIPFKIAKRSTKASDLTVKSAIYSSYYNQAVMSAFQEAIQPTLLYGSSAQYWDGAFVKLFEDSAIKCGYGRTRKIISGSKATGDSYVQESVVYKAKKGADIKATAAGEVIFAGYLEYSGYTVILEHGYGLKSWYMHLDALSVTTNDRVEAGAVIGSAGSTGFFASDLTGVEFAMSVFDQFICPYDLWNDGEYKGLTFPTN